MKTPLPLLPLIVTFLLSAVTSLPGASAAAKPQQPGDQMVAGYFRGETARVNAGTFADVTTREDWLRQKDRFRVELQEMLGLSPLPARTDLKPVVTGRVEHADFTVENLSYQALPGLYVGANFYLPKNVTGKIPAILYVCGHGEVKIDGVSYGNKTAYQHHGAWFARNGYACLIIDTIQLGELSGIHHGTYRHGLWWWNSRGYTPAGVEAWNSMRALDYLESRPEVDGTKLGMTGRSGGGAYTWYTAALDERVKAVVPVAGMTDLHNHVVDGTVSGHCDCMFMVNTYRWDYAKVAALIAPRALLFSNSDKDGIFPLDGVVRTHREVARIYQLLGASDKLGLLITEGPHKDTQELQVPAFRWFNRFLKGVDTPIEMAAKKMFTPQQLKVFAAAPSDERTTKIHETFVAAATPGVPANEAAWRQQRSDWMKALAEKSFAGWPASQPAAPPTQVGRNTHAGVTLTRFDFVSQEGATLPLFVFSRGAPETATRITARVLDDAGWAGLVTALGSDWSAQLGSPGTSPAPDASVSTYRDLHAQVTRGELAIAYILPRGIGPTAWTTDEKARVQIRRRFMLLGQTLDGMRVWDIRRAVDTLRRPECFGNKPIQLAGERDQSVNALYASLFLDGVASMELIAPPASHMSGPDYLNVLRFLDIPQAAAMSAERRPIKFTDVSPEAWSWTRNTASKLGWSGDRLRW